MDQIVSVIEGLKTQYRENGIARWAVVDKVSMECVGWSGLKYYREPLNNHLHFYELGYRFKKKHWGKGFATESSSGIVDYGFKNLPIASVFAITHPRNLNSQKVLVKLGFNFVETFDDAGQATHWYELKKTNWEKGIKHPSENT